MSLYLNFIFIFLHIKTALCFASQAVKFNNKFQNGQRRALGMFFVSLCSLSIGHSRELEKVES